jgi:hypothetical protein
LDDGSAGADVTIRYALMPVKTFFFACVREGDRWLIDGALGETSFSVLLQGAVLHTAVPLEVRRRRRRHRPGGGGKRQ